MKTFITAVLGTMLLMLPVKVYADGNELLKQCLVTERFLNEDKIEIGDGIKYGRCLGLLQGIKDTLVIMGEYGPFDICMPGGAISNQQMVRVVVAYLKDNPSKLHREESILTIEALAKAFPCRDEQKSP